MLNSIQEKYSHKVNAYASGMTTDQVSHELRISLTGILGANYLLDQTDLNEQQQVLIKLINASAKRLLALAERIA